MPHLNIRNLQRFWAKTTHDKESAPHAYHPLLCHLIDVAAVSAEMWRQIVSTAWRKRICTELGVGDEKAAKVISWLAGLHDLGKASPPFALRTDSPSARSLREMFRQTSYDVAGDAPPARDAPHGTVTTFALTEILINEYQVRSSLAKQLATLIGGHHGIFPSKPDVDKVDVHKLLGNKAWTYARRELVFKLGTLLEVAPPLPALKLEKLSDAATMLLAGLISTADWIGSDTRYFPCAIHDYHQPREIDFDSYLNNARDAAQKALAELGWLASPSAKTGTLAFPEMFPHVKNSLRPLQTVAVEISRELKGAGMAIIEAPMGEGKTEAAMYLADAWGRVTGGRGYYFALPTQATSNQMFTRVEDFLRVRYANESGIALQLLHGHAALSAEFSDLITKGKVSLRNSVAPHDVFSDEAKLPHATRHSTLHTDKRERGNVIAAEWFTYRKRGLLAAFGVGTIDQALLAALQTPHVFVRLFGLAGKVVIIDEVHAYDAYMAKLLERLIEWLAALSSPVILLSATLPRARTKALLDAYLKGARRFSTDGETVDDSSTPELITAITTDATSLADYPRITWIGDSSHEGLPIASRTIETSSHARRTLQLLCLPGLPTNTDDEKLQLSIKELAKKLRGALADGGCAAVICNTVTRAQKVYQGLQTYFDSLQESSTQNAMALDLLHSRFIFQERQARELRTLLRFGKHGAEVKDTNGTAHKVVRPKRAVLVATQIIEQSLDIDFDLMVTELAPFDLMLQRSGRLHRHHQTRPPNLLQPTLWIIKPLELSDGKIDFGSSKYVYDQHTLLRSWLELKERVGKSPAAHASIKIPDEIETIIENIYDETRPCPDEAMRAMWNETLTERLQKLQAEEMEAKNRWLKRPNADVNLSDFTAHPRDEDEPDFHPTHQALTRLTEPTVQVACLYGEDETTAFLDAGLHEAVTLTDRPTIEAAKKILFRAITISGFHNVLPLIKQEVPRGWQKSALLRHTRLLRMNERDEAHLAGRSYRLDAKLGLVIEKQKG